MKFMQERTLWEQPEFINCQFPNKFKIGESNG